MTVADSDHLPLPATGALVEGRHRLAMRVYYEDTDFGGIVYHANYLKFAERGRTEFLRCLGIDQTAMKRDLGLVFVARHLEIDFLAPARMDDRLLVTSEVASVTGARLSLRQHIDRIDDDAPGMPRSGHRLATVSVLLVCLGAGGRPARLPADIRKDFAACRSGALP